MGLFGGNGDDGVPLDGSAPALRPCRFCGSEQGRLTGPVGPHENGVRCMCCDRHLGWLPRPKDQPDEPDLTLIED